MKTKKEIQRGDLFVYTGCTGDDKYIYGHEGEIISVPGDVDAGGQKTTEYIGRVCRCYSCIPEINDIVVSPKDIEVIGHFEPEDEKNTLFKSVFGSEDFILAIDRSPSMDKKRTDRWLVSFQTPEINRLIKNVSYFDPMGWVTSPQILFDWALREGKYKNVLMYTDGYFPMDVPKGSLNIKLISPEGKIRDLQIAEEQDVSPKDLEAQPKSQPTLSLKPGAVVVIHKEYDMSNNCSPYGDIGIVDYWDNSCEKKHTDPWGGYQVIVQTNPTRSIICPPNKLEVIDFIELEEGLKVGDIFVYTGGYEGGYGSLGEVVESPGNDPISLGKFYHTTYDRVNTYHICHRNVEVIDHIEREEEEAQPKNLIMTKELAEQLGLRFTGMCYSGGFALSATIEGLASFNVEGNKDITAPECIHKLIKSAYESGIQDGKANSMSGIRSAAGKLIEEITEGGMSKYNPLNFLSRRMPCGCGGLLMKIFGIGDNKTTEIVEL
ncbi:MAG: hypothetical protein D4S01_10120 [Dehalococcoidia bacterium]|nr:MAG: hypothetical protein D4S01_10120 [Dehalococcoidia bacterium]